MTSDALSADEKAVIDRLEPLLGDPAILLGAVGTPELTPISAISPRTRR